MNTRSDTFTIRAYGENSNDSNEATSRAVCEAIVQRLPEYVNLQDKSYVSPNNSENINFGRRFVIVSLRWLKPEEL